MSLHEAIARLEPIVLADYMELPEVTWMANCPQSPIYHAEGSVLKHTEMVMRSVYQDQSLPSDLKRQVYLAAFLHDLGKVRATTISPEGYVRARNYVAAGSALVRAALHRLEVPVHLRTEVTLLVNYHQHPLKLVKQEEIYGTQLEQVLYRRLAAFLDLRLLAVLAHADWQGRRGRGRTAALRLLPVFKERAARLGLWGKRFQGLLDDEELGLLDPCERRRLRRHLLIETLKGRIKTAVEARAYLAAHPELMSPRSAHLYLMCGVPGSGKSTWIKKHMPDALIVSSDSKRENLFGDESFQGDNARVFAECRRDVERGLAAGAQVVVDATNILREHRADFLAIANLLGAHTTIVYFDVTPEMAIERNLQRDRRVPEESIRDYFDRLEEPTLLEADRIIRV